MWDETSLYAKARLYVRKGMDHGEPMSPEVPLWCILSLELLARAVVSKVNPALLADPKDGANILSACGFPGKTAPISISAKTVFHRCVVVCPGFSKKEYDRCIEWVGWRNEELHTGALPFQTLTTSKWLPRFFRTASILLAAIKKDLADYVGKDHAANAVRMLDALSASKKKEAHDAVRAKRNEFESLAAETRLEQLKVAKEKLKSQRRVYTKDVECPSCKGPALVHGDLVRSTNPRDSDGELVQEDLWLPTSLKCLACGLELKEHSHVDALGFGDQFATTDVLDPKEYYDIQFDPAGHYEPDYGND